jgi:hypothetical protein
MKMILLCQECCASVTDTEMLRSTMICSEISI